MTDFCEISIDVGETSIRNKFVPFLIMDPSWEFQAPQFVDFNNLDRVEADNKKADDFFNVDMESGELWTTALSSLDNEAEEDDHPVLPPPNESQHYQILDVHETTATESSSHFNRSSRVNNVLNVTQVVSNKSSVEDSKGSSSNVTDAPTFSNAPLVPRQYRKPANLVTSWGSGPVNKATIHIRDLGMSSSSKQPIKKRRRLSNAIVHSLNSPARNNNSKSSKIMKMQFTPRRTQAGSGSISGYKSGGTPKRLGTNTTEPRLAINMWKKKSSLLSGLEENSRPKSAPASGSSSSKFFVTKPRPFKLSTEVRAEERKVLDHKRKEEESLKDKLRQKELAKQRKANEEELLKYRQSLVHKALPIKQYRKIEIKRSDKMLTFPESPQLSGPGFKARSKLCSV